MKKIAAVVFVLLVFALAAGAVYFVAKVLPHTEYRLKIQKSISGIEMVFESINFKKESNVLHIDGRFLNGYSPEDYDVRATIGDSESGPASGPYYWFMLLPNQGAKGQPFILEFDNPPSTSPILFCHVYFIKKDNPEIAFTASFQTPNPARQKPIGLIASALPQTQKTEAVNVTLQSLETGFNQVPKDTPPRWTSIAAFATWENGKPSTNWRLMDLLVTPNAGRAFRSNLGVIYKDNTIRAPISGTLWKEDAPFKLRAVFFRVGDLPKSDLFQLADVVIPKPGEMLPLKRKWNNVGVNIEFVGIYGAGAKLPAGVLESEKTTSPLPCLIYTITDQENTYLEFIAQHSEMRSRNVAEFRKPQRGKALQYFSIVDVDPEDSVTFEFALIREKKEFSFTATPSPKN